MNILFLTRAYGEHAGGMERLSYELAQHLSQHPDTEVTVISHTGPRATAPLFNLLALPKALTAAREADVIHLGDPMLSFLGWKLKKLTGKPVSVTVHGLDITYPNFLYQLYLKVFFRKFDVYLPISKYVASILKNHNVQGRIEVVNPGIADRFYDPTISRSQLEKFLNQGLSGKKVLFTSGRLIKRKGHEWFIREILPKLPQNVIYVIAGRGPEAARIAQASEESGVAERTVLLGKVSDDQLKVLYNTVDAFIMPNIPIENDVEGFGLVLLEAALCNRPVFAAEVDGIPDAVHDSKSGTLLPTQHSSAWIKALNDFLAQPQTASSRPYTLENFSWANQAAAYQQTWQRLYQPTE